MIMEKKNVINVCVSPFFANPLSRNQFFFTGKLKFHFVIYFVNFLFLLTTNLIT